MAKLTIKDEHDVERVHELGNETLTVGRSPESMVRVTDQKFSRSHFKIEKSGEYYVLTDMGSTNGTRVNGQKVTSEKLRAGDVIKVGATTFKYDGPSPPSPAPSAAPEGATKAHGSEPAKHIIVMVEGGDPGKKFDLGNAPFTVGRHPSNVLQLTDEAASSYHAEIKKEPIGYIVSDLGSTNGTRVRAKGQEKFEKIVKTPLTHGMQMRIGKTIFEFRNVGGPSSDDKILATIPLDPDKVQDRLHEKIAERPRRPSSVPKVAVGLLAVVVFIGVIFLVLHLVPPPDDNGAVKKEDPVALGNLVRNHDFSAGFTDTGIPKGWRLSKGEPGVRVTVEKEEEALPSDDPEAKPGALVILKSGAKNAACHTNVMTEDKVRVDSDKVYELSGYLKGDGDGLFGLRVTWFKGERRLDQHEIVLVAPQPEWKLRSHDVRPPAWADRAEVGVFAEGREGRACFDNLSFKIKPEGRVDPLPTVSFGEVGVLFEAPSGAFSAKSRGEPVIEGMDLSLAGKNGRTVGSILSAIAPSVTSEQGKTSIHGRLFDFTLQQTTNYVVSAAPGTWGVDLSLAVDRGDGQTSRPRLRFYLVGDAGNGDLEVVRSGNEQILSGMEKHQLSDVGAVLFNAGKTPQLYMKFSVPISLETRREGDRRLVQINFPSQLGIELAPENVGARKAFLAKKRELDDVLRSKKWASVWSAAKQLEERYGKRFQEAGAAAKKARTVVENSFKPVRSSIENQVSAMANLKNFDAVKEFVQKEAPPWVGTPFERNFNEWLSLVEKSQDAYLESQGEAKARELFDRARKMTAMSDPQWQVVASLCRAVIQRYPKTKSAAEAQQLLDKAEAAQRERDRLVSISDKLKIKAKPYVIAGQWAEAAAIIEGNEDYQKNRAKLPEITKLVREWKEKARTQ